MRFFTLLAACCLACAGLVQAQATSVARVAEYGQLVQAKLQDYVVHVPAATINATVEVLVSMDETGHVTSAKVQHSSGVAAMDAMAVNAIQKASPLPLDHGKPVPSISFLISNPAP